MKVRRFFLDKAENISFYFRKKTNSIRNRWILNSLSLIIAVLLITAVSASLLMSNYYYSSVKSSLSQRATSTAKFINNYMNRSYNEFYQSAETLTRDFNEKNKFEMQVLDAYGRVMYSSSGLAAGFTPGTDDVNASLAGESVAIWYGYDDMSGEKVMAASSPLYFSSGLVIGTVRYITSLEKIDERIFQSCMIVFIIAALVFMLVLISNNFFLKSIVRPVLRINEAAKEIAAGSYGIHIEKTDDDEIGELCDTINYMSDEISKSETIKNEFISSVSHELRTPLTAIGGWTDTILADGIADKEVAAKGLSIIQKEVRRLSQMVEELLDFARIEGDRMSIQTSPFDIREELSDAVFIYSEFVGKEGIEINSSDPDDPVIVNGDRNRLKQVFLNIIDNAVKYCGENKKIDIEMTASDNKVKVAVTDYGVGIPEEELPFVKKKFYKGSSKIRGNGIGLAVCEEIIKRHGGSLDIKSEYGKGTTAIITLPTAALTADNIK